MTLAIRKIFGLGESRQEVRNSPFNWHFSLVSNLYNNIFVGNQFVVEKVKVLRNAFSSMRVEVEGLVRNAIIFLSVEMII